MKNLQPNFAGGVLSEGMLARGDLVKYRVGVADAVNVFVKQQGGLANRPGFIEAGMDVTGGGPPPVLIPFQFSADEAYILEFHDHVYRVLLDGSYILDPAVMDRTVTSVSTAANPLWTFPALGVSTGNLVYFSAPAGNWLNGKLARVTDVSQTAARLQMESGVPLDTRAGAPSLAGVRLSRVYEGSHPYDVEDLPKVRYAQDADYLYLAHKDYPPHRIRRVGHAEWVSEPLDFSPTLGPVFTDMYRRYITSFTQEVDPVFTVTNHGLSVGETVLIRIDPGNWLGVEPLRVSEVLGPHTLRLRTLPGNVVLNGIGKNQFPAGTELQSNAVAVEISPDDTGENAVPESYRVAAVTEEGEEGPPSAVMGANIDLTVRGNRAVPLWRAVPGAKRYIVYREMGGAYGYIGATENTYFIDNNIAPDMSQGPQEPRNPFSGPGDYPGIVAFHEQRLFYAATHNDPQVVHGSQTANPLNFAISYPPQGSDAVTFRPKHKHVNEIRALVSSSSLLLLTSGGEWALSGGDDGRPITPNNLFLRPVSYWGSAAVEPALIGDVVVMLQRGGRIARDYRVGGDRPTDLTIMAVDLFRGATVAGWAYCQTPYSVLWVALSDGNLLSLTYNSEHDIWGWTRHQLGGGGKVLGVATILEGAEDVLYVVTERATPTGGRTVKTERLSTRYDSDPIKGIYLDAARHVTYDNPVGVATGFLHLAGRRVTALVDGNVYYDLLVGPNGEVDIGERSGRRWTVGFPYTASIRTLPFETETQDEGSTLGDKRRATGATVLVERTRGLWIGDAPERMEQVKEWAVLGDDVTLIPLKTTTWHVDFAGDWAERPTITIEQRDPLPMTLLGVAPEWHMGG